MKIVTLLNEKGGVGKTTLAVNIAAGLADRGYRVLVVDTDEQGHVATALGLNKEPGFFRLLEMRSPWRDIIRQVPQERYQSPGPLIDPRLFILPGDKRTRALPFIIEPNSNLLRDRLMQLHKAFDYVFIDTAPAASLMHLLIYRATDYVLYPTKLEALSFDGLVESVEHLERANQDRKDRRDPQIRVLGIVPTMYRESTVEHKANLALLRSHYHDNVWEPVRERILWSESSAQQRSVFGYAPTSEAAQECRALIDRVEQETKQHEPA